MQNDNSFNMMNMELPKPYTSFVDPIGGWVKFIEMMEEKTGSKFYVKKRNLIKEI
jgi:hypothetical protein